MSKKNSVGELYNQLQVIVEWFESADSTDVDKALSKYEEGQKITAKLQAELSVMKNKIESVDIGL